MKKKILLFLIAFLLITNQSIVNALELTHIGVESVRGSTFSKFWYTGNIPGLSGYAEPNSQISVTINNSNNILTAAQDGQWFYNPATLNVGDNQVSITGDGEAIEFVLNYSSSQQATDSTQTETEDSTDPEELPQTGSILPLMSMVSLGLIALGIGLISHKSV